MDALARLSARPTSPAAASQRAEEEEFQQLVESIATLLSTSADRTGRLDRCLLAQSLTELGARWPATGAASSPPWRGWGTAPPCSTTHSASSSAGIGRANR